MKKVQQRRLIFLPILFILAVLSGCGGGGDDDYTAPPEEPAQPPVIISWIEIDSPTVNQSFTRLPITISGRAGMVGGSDPVSTSVRIQFDYQATIHDLVGTISCEPTCVVNWEATLDEAELENSGGEGSRTIRVWYQDSYNSVKINFTAARYTVRGKITNPGATSNVEDIDIWLDDTTIATSDPNGNYQFEARDGDYLLTARLGPLPNKCLLFSPAERNLTIDGANLSGQDFTIADTLGCYNVSGHVSADNNPGYYPDYSDDPMVISKVFMYNGDKTKLLTSTWIDLSGNYKFEYIPSGSYILTPGVATWGNFMGVPSPVSVPGHDKSIYVSFYDVVAELYLDF